MLIFVDTEFTDFHDPELISLGAVSECGRFEFYAERNDFDLSKCSEFVRGTVLPRLGQEGLDRSAFAEELLNWLERLRTLDGNVVALYDYDTDFDLLKAAIGRAPAWLDGINICDDVLCASWLKNDGSKEHHALHDARMLRADWLASRAQQTN